MEKNHKIQAKSLPFILILTLVLCLYTLILGVMIYLALSTSLKEYADFALNSVFALPEKLSFENYAKAFSAFKVRVNGNRYVYFGEMLINSIIHAVGCALAAVFVKALVAYVVAKYDEKFNKFIYMTVIIGMIVPIIGSLPSEIQIAKALGLYNTRFGMVVMRASHLGMHFLILLGTFRGLSDEYIEAAEMDGAGQWHVLFRIVLPLVKTTLFALFILNFIACWNEYQGPLVYMGSYPTAAVGLFKYVYQPSQSGTSVETLQMAGCMLLFLPILILFLCFKNVFMGNLTVGGIKG